MPEPPLAAPGGLRDAGSSRSAPGPRFGTAAPADPSNALSAIRYLAWLYSPPAQQPVLAALCEIESEVVSSIRPGIDHHVAHARLQWWREECERSAQERPVHPLTRKLAATYGGARAASGGELGASVPSPLAGILGFVDTAVWDLAAATFETRKELTAYCERWAAAMFQSAVAIWDVARIASRGATGSATAKAAAASNAPDGSVGAGAAAKSSIAGGSVAGGAPGASNASRWLTLGAAVREIELLADLAREAQRGRLRVPLDELERAGADFTVVSKPPWPAELAGLLNGRHEALRGTVAGSVAAFGRDEQAEFRGLMVWAALAWRQSLRAQRALPNTVLPRRYDALADGWQAWRAARRAVAGNLRLS
jgi:phytoene/squalene synthetase